MLNQVVLVGEIVETPTIEKTKKGVTVVNVLLKVQMAYKDVNGKSVYEIFPVELWAGIGEECISLLTPNAMVGIKGRISSRPNQVNDRVFYNLSIKAEKVSVLSNQED